MYEEKPIRTNMKKTFLAVTVLALCLTSNVQAIAQHSVDYTTHSFSAPSPGDSVVIWCSPEGDDATADGSMKHPYFDLQQAIDKAQPGTTIMMKSGKYVYNKRIDINDRNGRSDAYITLMCPDGRAVLDFSGQPYHSHSDNPYQGVRLTSSYWHFYKIDICNASDNGLLIERNKPMGGKAIDVENRTQDAHDNIIEFCNFFRNGDSGLQMKNLAAFNYVINCDSYENKDEGDGDADGFAPKISIGDGNYFFGCRAFHNSDDGYDVFFKKDSGFADNRTIVFENCLAYENGWINGKATKGNMNGFKCGSKQGRMNVVLNRCLAVNNGSKGFDQNHNTGDIILNNCTGYSLKSFGSKSYSYRIYEALASGSVCEVSNCIAINDYTNKSATAKGEYGSKDKVYGRTQVTVASKEQTNDWLCSKANFVSMDNSDELIAERDSLGNLNWDKIDWGHPTASSSVIVDKGTVVGNNNRYANAGVVIPGIEYAGTAPDLGAFEEGMESKKIDKEITNGIGSIKTSTKNGKSIRIARSFNGIAIISIEGGKATDTYTASIYDINGAFLGANTFRGTNTAINIPIKEGAVIIKVNGRNFNKAVKVVL